MIKQFNDAANAATLLSVYNTRGICVPLSPFDGYPPDIYTARVVTVVRKKIPRVTALTGDIIDMVTLVTLVTLILTYRTCARARACMYSFYSITYFILLLKDSDHGDHVAKTRVIK